MTKQSFQITRIMILGFIILFLMIGCKGGGGGTPIEPDVNYDPVYLTLQRAADALEKEDLEECLKYYLDPERNREPLESFRGVWKIFAKALREAEIVRSDDEQVRFELRFDYPNIPDEYKTSNFYAIRVEDDKWLLSPTPIKYFSSGERKAEWNADFTHCTLLTRLIVKYYVSNYPQDVHFTGPDGLFNQDKWKYQVVATHPEYIDFVYGERDIYDNIPDNDDPDDNDAYLLPNAPAALLQIGSVDEDVFLGEYLDSAGNMKPNNRFKRDVYLEKDKIKTYNAFEPDDDTILKGHAHFMTPYNNEAYPEDNFIGFNDLKALGYGDLSDVTAPAYRWGLGLEKIGQFVVDWDNVYLNMRENWNRKTWQYAIDLYKDAMQIPNPYDAERLTKVSNSFYALGHILHLLQDCGNPAHVRNDMHGINWLYHVPGLEFVKPDPFEVWAESMLIVPESFSIHNELISEANPIDRSQSGFNQDEEPLLQNYYLSAQTQYPGYEALFKSLAYMTNRTFISDDTIGRSTQAEFAQTHMYPTITKYDNSRGKPVLYGKAGLYFYNEEHPLAVASSDFNLWAIWFYWYYERWPTWDDVIAALPSHQDLFTTWDEWDDDYYTDGRKGVMETAWEVQLKRIIRHGAALLHEFYIAVHGDDTPFNPVIVKTVDTPGSAYGVYVTGGYAYVADYYSGLQIIDVDPIGSASIVKTVDTPGSAYGVYLTGGYAYVGDGSSGLQIIDVEPLGSASIVKSVDNPDYARVVYVSGGYAYVADGGSGLQIIDVDPPESASIVKTVYTPYYALGVYVTSGYAYVADGSSGLQIIDVEPLGSASIVKSVDTPGYALGVYVTGGYTYVADNYTGLQIIDIEPIGSASIVKSVDTPDVASGVYVTGGYAYVADWVSGLQIIDVEPPESASIMKTVETPGLANGVYVTGGYAYVADGGSGLQIIKLW